MKDLKIQKSFEIELYYKDPLISHKVILFVNDKTSMNILSVTTNMIKVETTLSIIY